ncbi:MAG: DUF2304 domain-containing protein [Patescibacteria group bacterium]
MIIQFLLTLIAVAGLALVWRRASQGVLSRIESLSWSLLWVGGIIVVWRPEVATRLAHLVGVGRGVDVVTYLVLAFVCILLFQAFLAIDRLERKLTDLVRADALRDLEKKG